MRSIAALGRGLARAACMEVKEERGEVADLSRHPLSCAVSVSELFFVCASMNA